MQLEQSSQQQQQQQDVNDQLLAVLQELLTT